MERKQFRIGSMPEREAIPYIVEMLMTLRASVDAMAMMLCDLRAEIRGEQSATNEKEAAYYKDYLERVDSNCLEDSFRFSERFPLTDREQDKDT